MGGNEGWIGVDLDGTLAEYHGWKGTDHIGEPIPAMLRRVKLWLDNGIEVRIFTARVAPTQAYRDQRTARQAIDQWCRKHLGGALVVTNQKDFSMIELWDDRCVQVETNTGRLIGPEPEGEPTP